MALTVGALALEGYVPFKRGQIYVDKVRGALIRHREVTTFGLCKGQRDI